MGETVMDPPKRKRGRPKKVVEPPRTNGLAPLSEFQPDKNVPGHVQVRLDRHHGIALQRMFHGLREDGAILKNGHHIDHFADVIRWVLEQHDGI